MFVFLLYVLMLLHGAFTIEIDSAEMCTTARDKENSVSENICQLSQKVEELDGAVSRLAIQPATQTTNCSGVRYSFPRKQQIEDYVRLRTYFPRLSAATICTWVNIADMTQHKDHSISTIISYATELHNNIFVFYKVHSKNILELVINQKGIQFEYLLPANRETHLCLWFDSDIKIVGLYVNGLEHSMFGYEGGPISGGGSLILGQEQDSVGGSFKSHQYLSGTISNLAFYPRVLTSLEIFKMAQLCECPVDQIVHMSLDRVELWGEANYEILKECPTM